MSANVKIPVAIQIVADDFGWHNGRDERTANKPSRSGLPRFHALEDYLVVNEIGKGIDMKILTPFVIGEWDKDNILRGVKGVTYNEKGWDRASEIDMNLAQKCFEAAESSEYIEYAYHGLLHGYYKDDKQICETEYSRPRFDEKTGTFDRTTFDYIPESEMQNYIDTFFKIYDSWGFKKKIRAFVSPCSIHTPPERTGDFAKRLKKNGFIYWANMWELLGDTTTVIDGVTFLKKGRLGVDWDEYDVSPITLFDHSVTQVGDKEYINPATNFHWTNFLRLCPQDNMERVGEWIKYFKRMDNVFGTMLSKDVAFAANQVLYSRFSKVTSDGKKYTIDFTDVDNKGSLGLRDSFHISVKGLIKPDSCVGAKLTLDSHKRYHKNYVFERINNAKTITFELV